MSLKNKEHINGHAISKTKKDNNKPLYIEWDYKNPA